MYFIWTGDDFAVFGGMDACRYAVHALEGKTEGEADLTEKGENATIILKYCGKQAEIGCDRINTVRIGSSG